MKPEFYFKLTDTEYKKISDSELLKCLKQYNFYLKIFKWLKILNPTNIYRCETRGESEEDLGILFFRKHKYDLVSHINKNKFKKLKYLPKCLNIKYIAYSLIKQDILPKIFNNKNNFIFIDNEFVIYDNDELFSPFLLKYNNPKFYNNIKAKLEYEFNIEDLKPLKIDLHMFLFIKNENVYIFPLASIHQLSYNKTILKHCDKRIKYMFQINYRKLLKYIKNF